LPAPTSPGGAGGDALPSRSPHKPPKFSGPLARLAELEKFGLLYDFYQRKFGFEGLLGEGNNALKFAYCLAIDFVPGFLLVPRRRRGRPKSKWNDPVASAVVVDLIKRLGLANTAKAASEIWAEALDPTLKGQSNRTAREARGRQIANRLAKGRRLLHKK
jgi:hypothetical protein